VKAASLIILLLFALPVYGQYLELAWGNSILHEEMSDAWVDVSAAPDGSIYVGYTRNFGSLLRFVRYNMNGTRLWVTQRDPYPQQNHSDLKIREITAGHEGALAVWTGTLLDEDIAATIAIDTSGNTSRVRELRHDYLFPHSVYTTGQYALLADYYEADGPPGGFTWLNRYNVSGGLRDSREIDADHRGRDFSLYFSNLIPNALYLVHTTNDEILYLDDQGHEIGRVNYTLDDLHGYIFSHLDGSIYLNSNRNLALLAPSGELIVERVLENDYEVHTKPVYDPRNGFVFLTKEETGLYCACYNLLGELVSEERIALADSLNFATLMSVKSTWGGGIVYVGRNEHSLRIGRITVGDFPQDYNLVESSTPAERIDHLEIQIHPNPANALTTVTIALPEASNLTVTVFNTLGQLVAELVNGRVNAGRQTLTFDASDLSSGIYFIQATVPGKLDAMQKIVLVK
jgi:Secretion system C-terminal sorting domain